MAGPLTDALTVPLNVWLLRETYIATRRDPTGLLEADRFPTQVAIQTHLLDRIIPAVLDARPPSRDKAVPFHPRRSWDTDDFRRWLGYLAHHLSEHDTRDFAWWHLARHTLRHTTFAEKLAAALTYKRAPVSWLYEHPGYVNLRLSLSKRIPGSGAWNLLAVGLVGAIGGAVKSGLTGALAVGLSMTVLTVAFGLVPWVENPPSTGTARTPESSCHADRTLILLRMLTGILTLGLIVALAGTSLGKPADAIVLGLVFGLIYGITSGNHHAWVVFVVATYRLALAGRLPRRLMAFLDDAHRLGLLRAVGPVYQFRHADLQDHLAATYAPARDRDGPRPD